MSDKARQIRKRLSVGLAQRYLEAKASPHYCEGTEGHPSGDTTMPEEKRHIESVEETDDSVIVTYAKAEKSSEPEPPIEEESAEPMKDGGDIEEEEEDYQGRGSDPCRLDSETKQECIDRKIPTIKTENPNMSDEQVYAIASEMCSTACSESDSTGSGGGGGTDSGDSSTKEPMPPSTAPRSVAPTEIVHRGMISGNAGSWEGATLSRTFSVTREAVDAENRTVHVAFSSETPVDRAWGTEVLDHSKESIRTERLRDHGPLLLEHDPEKHIGVIQSVSIGDDRVARASVRFGNSALANETFQDVKDGIKRHISVGYVINEVQKESKEDRDIYRATNWEPLEISWVSVPADHHVGIGRSNSNNSETDKTPKEAIVMSEKDTNDIVQDARATEMARIKDIEQLGQSHKETEMAREHIQKGSSVDEFRADLLHKIASKPQETAEIGLSKTEKRDFSFLKALRALGNPTDRKAQEDAAFEFEASHAAAQKQGRESRGITIPQDVLGSGKRDLAGATSLVGTDHIGSDFIDALASHSVAFPLCTKLTGLVGDVSIPRGTNTLAAAYVAESTEVATQTPTFDSVTLQPSTLGCYTKISRKMLLQADPSVEQLVRNDLAQAVALKIDQTIMNGSGTGAEPTGLGQLSSMTDQLVVNGTNGATETWAKVVEYESNVAAQNAASSNMAYILHPSLAGAWKSTPSDTGSGWMNIQGGGPVGTGTANGFPVYVSSQLPNNLTKGSNSDCFLTLFGDWSSAIVGMWSGLDLMADPYSMGTQGGLQVTVFQDLDVQFRHKESFALSKDSRTS